jgi:hypothetical protein
MSSETFGKLNAELNAEENLICRNIAKEISQFGINDKQRKFLIYLLSLELEDINLMRDVAQVVRENSNSSFLIPQEESEVQ